MNRLSPLIVRRVGPLRRGAAARRAPSPSPAPTPPRWLDDLRLFATGWIGGLVFFGTLFG